MCIPIHPLISLLHKATRDWHHPALIGGDFNLRHKSCNPLTPKNYSGSPPPLAEWIENSDFYVMNSPLLPTYFGHNRQHHSTLDLTLCNSHFESALPSFWWADKDNSFLSDHAFIAVNSKTLLLPIHSDNPLPFNTSKTNIAKFQLSLEWNLNHHQDLYDSKRSDVTSLYNSLKGDILDTIAMSSPWSHISPHSKSWWNDDLTRLKKEIQISKQELKKLRTHSPGSAFIEAETHILHFNKHLFRNEVKKAKKTFFNKILENVDPSSLWDVTKWGKGVRKYLLPPIKFPESTPPIFTISPSDKAATFTKTFFPPSQSTSLPLPPLMQTPSQSLLGLLGRRNQIRLLLGLH